MDLKNYLNYYLFLCLNYYYLINNLIKVVGGVVGGVESGGEGVDGVLIHYYFCCSLLFLCLKK